MAQLQEQHFIVTAKVNLSQSSFKKTYFLSYNNMPELELTINNFLNSFIYFHSRNVVNSTVKSVM